MPLTGERKRAYMRKRHAENRDKLNAKSAAYYAENREELLEKGKVYNKANPHVNKKAVARYQAKKKKDPAWRAEQSAKSATWRAENPERANAACRRYHRKHYNESDANFVIKCRLRSRLAKKLKSRGIRKTVDTMALTGCTADFLRGYLEARFEPGMTWKNVQIDHHIPCAEFDLRDPDQQRQCFHYSNLRPMRGADNQSKGAKPPAPHQAELI